MEKNKSYKVLICRGNERGCPFVVNNISKLQQEIESLFEQLDFETIYRKKTPGMFLAHHIFTVAISGCSNACSQPQIKDIGIISKVKITPPIDQCSACLACARFCMENAISINSEKNKIIIDPNLCINCGACRMVCKSNLIKTDTKGYQVLAGGKLGRHPQLAVEVIDFTPEDNLLNIVENILIFFLANGVKSEKMAGLINRLNIDTLKSSVLKPSVKE